MKEQYFTGKSISLSARSMMEELDELNLLRKNHPKLDSTALIIIDMQRYFLEEGSHAFIPTAPVIIDRLIRLAGLYRNRKQPVFLTRHIDDGEDPGMMGKWWGGMLEEGNPLSGLHSGLEGKGEVIRKSGYDAFLKTGLEDMLRSKEVEGVVITGVMTHICCAATAMSAFARGFEVILPVDGTATCNRLFHEAALLNLAHSCARAVTLDSMEREMESR